MTVPTYRLFIDGQAVDTSDHYELRYPFNGEVVGNIPLPKGQRSPDQWFNVNSGFNKVSAQQLANNLQTFPLRFSGVRADGQSTFNASLRASSEL